MAAPRHVYEIHLNESTKLIRFFKNNQESPLFIAALEQLQELEMEHSEIALTPYALHWGFRGRVVGNMRQSGVDRFHMLVLSNFLKTYIEERKVLLEASLVLV